MAVSDIEAVLEFLRKNGFSESESALMEDVIEKSQLGSFDFERFLFPMVPPPPPLKIPANFRRLQYVSGGDDTDADGRDDQASSLESSEEEFVSLGSSSTELCSSEFTNPYGIRTATRLSSQSSSDRLSQFGTARDYYEFDMQNDLYWYKERDEDYAMPPHFGISDFNSGPSEDKLVMSIQTGKRWDDGISSNHMPEEIQCLGHMKHYDRQWTMTSTESVTAGVSKNFEQNFSHEGSISEHKDTAYSCSVPLCACHSAGSHYNGDPAHHDFANVKVSDSNGNLHEPIEEVSAGFDAKYPVKINSAFDWLGNLETHGDSEIHCVKEDCQLTENGYHAPGDDAMAGETCNNDAAANEEIGATSDEPLMYSSNEDDFEVFNLKIIHRKNRTGFEENKDFPVVLNSIVAGRYCIMEYLGSAAFSKVIQAHDLHTGIDVCLKIIKNNKDFFDQSLDEIKLLKFVNKHDPGDERHILRLYDYFYHQEHLFIVCELLRANLYEFQKYNRESGGEPYFTLSKLQVITRQCLEALEYLHALGIIHCDLKPENILIKSYRRCEIKVIDLGSSCFQTDNLSLYVQSRSYRAPEVILGLPYDQKIDLWSLGCILAELYSGEVLFPNEAIAILLARMMAILGPINMDILQRGVETHKYFTKEYDLYYVNEETNELEYITPEDSSSLEHHLQISDPLFIDFMRKLLKIDPQDRLTAREAQRHPWLSYSYHSNPS